MLAAAGGHPDSSGQGRRESRGAPREGGSLRETEPEDAAAQDTLTRKILRILISTLKCSNQESLQTIVDSYFNPETNNNRENSQTNY